MAPSFPRGCPISSSMLPTKVDIPYLPKSVPLVLSVSKSFLRLMYSQMSFETFSLNAKRWGHTCSMFCNRRARSRQTS